MLLLGICFYWITILAHAVMNVQDLVQWHQETKRHQLEQLIQEENDRHQYRWGKTREMILPDQDTIARKGYIGKCIDGIYDNKNISAIIVNHENVIANADPIFEPKGYVTQWVFIQFYPQCCQQIESVHVKWSRDTFRECSPKERKLMIQHYLGWKYTTWDADGVRTPTTPLTPMVKTLIVKP